MSNYIRIGGSVTTVDNEGLQVEDYAGVMTRPINFTLTHLSAAGGETFGYEML